jgi:hypothetical protein
LVKAYQNKPVKFLAILANSTLSQATDYQVKYGLRMPIFADSLGLMQKRYGFKISLNNIWQYRVVGPDGTLISYQMTAEALDKSIAATKPGWKYRDEKYHAKLASILDLLEDSQYAAAIRKLRPLRNTSNKALTESANQLFAVLKEEAARWKTEADSAAATDPVKAHDLYNRVVAVAAGTDLARSVAEPLKKLSANTTVRNELAARKAFTTVKAYLTRLTPAQKQLVVKPCQQIARKYANTPTGDQAAALVKEIE